MDSAAGNPSAAASTRSFSFLWRGRINAHRLYRQQGSLLELLGIDTWSVSTSSSQHSPHLLWMCIELHTNRAQSLQERALRIGRAACPIYTIS